MSVSLQRKSRWGAIGTTLAMLACSAGATGPGDDEPATIPVLTSHLTDLSHVTHIVPPGSISGDELKGHSYVQTDGAGPVPVYAPVDMVLVEGTWVGMFDDFGLQFDINRRFRLRLGHITDPRSDIADMIPRDDPSSIFTAIGPLSLSAGELIGYTTGTPQTNGFDFGLYDLDVEVTTPNAARYRTTREWTKLNSVCGYSYFDPSLRSAYYERFGSIGGVLVPGAPCRTLSEVVGGGGLAGEWYLTSHTPDATYGARFAVGLDLGATAVRVAGIGGTIDVVGAADPQTISTEQCYSGNGVFVFLRLASATTVEVVSDAGDCPASFPIGSQRTYAR